MHGSSIALDRVAGQLWTTEVIPKVKDAVVYLDHHMAEALHWNRGATWLFESGALAVRELSHFELGHGEGEWQAVFLLGAPLVGSALSQVSAVVRASRFTSCTLITSCPPSAHHLAQYGVAPHAQQEPRDSFLHLEEQLLDWMGDMSFTAQVLYVPLSIISLTPSFFLMPQFHDIFPVLSGTQDPSTGQAKELGMLPRALQTSVQSLVGNLNSLFDILSVREDIFSLGPLSHIIGEELERCSRGRKKAGGLTLVLIDRTLDMAGALTSSCESLLDQVVRILPPLARSHSIDVQVDMGPLCTAKRSSSSVAGRISPCVAPGCLAHTDSTTAINHLVNSKHKECLMELNRLLVEWAGRHGVRMDVGGRLTPQQLQKRVLNFKGASRAVLKGGLLQQVLGVAQALTHPYATRLQDLLGNEKLLIQSTVADGVSPIVQLMRSRQTMGLCLEDVIVLLTLLYSLVGEKALGSDIEILKAEIVQAVYQEANENKLPPFLHDLVGEDSLEENAVLAAVEHILQVLPGLGSTGDTARHRLLLECSNTGAQPAVYKSLVHQLLQQLLQDNPAFQLEYHAGRLTDRIRTGFGFFKTASKPLPRDNPTIILFIVGGVTASEAKLVSDFVASSKINKQVVVGSTALAKPSEQLGLLFQRNLE